MTTSFTTHFRFGLPDFLSGPWHEDWYTLVHAIDRALYETVIVAGGSVWANSTDYTIGSIVISPQDGTLWSTAVAHTSAASPTTFSQDRIANPTFWNSLTGSVGGVVTAADVTFTPAGGIAATDVQAAIEELDTEKASVSHTHVIADISNWGTGIAAALAIAVGSAGAPVLFNGAGGTPSSLTLANATGLPIATGVSGLGANVAAFLAAPSSANLRAAITDESGTGALLFAGGDIGAATGTSLNLSGTVTVGNTGLVVGASTPFSDAAGTLTLQNVDALDATTESTIEAAIDTLANLTSVQGRTITLADAGADRVFGWDDSASAYQNLSAADGRAAVGLASTDSPTFATVTVGNTGLVVGASTPFSDAAGTLTLQNVDAIDATTESTIEAAIDTLANLTSVQGRTVTLADAGFDVLFGWDDSGSAYKNFALADILTEGSPATGDFVLIYGAEGDLRKVDWSGLPGAGGGAPTTAQYVVLSADGTLTQERVLTAGAGLTSTDGGAGSTITLDVVAGNTSLTVAANDVVVNLGHAFAWTAAHTFSRAGTPITSTNTTDAAANVALRLDSDRATMAANDEVITEFRLSDSAGNQDIFAEIRVRGTDVTSTSEDGEIRFRLVEAGTVTDELALDLTSLRPLTNDGLALGTTTLGWADLHLATGGVINWANGEVTLTETDANTLTMAGGTLVLPASGLQVGSSNPFSDAAGTLTLQNVDALDATTESTIEAAIDTLANLTSVQGLTVTLADAGFDVLFGWDDSGAAYKNFALADIATEAAPAAGDFVLIYGAEGDLRKVNWSGLPAGSGSPGGADTQVQFNDGGAFGGDSAFTWDKTNDILAVNGQGIFGHNASVAVNSGGADPALQAHAPFGDSGAAAAAFYYWAADANGPQFNFTKSRHATKGSHTVVQDGDDLGVLMFRGSDGTNFIQGAWIIAEVSGTPGTNDMPSRMLFGTTADGASSPTNRMIISADGAVTPAANDGTSLGSTTLQWSDLFLAEGGVINFDNGDMTLTQSGNNLTVAGGTLTVNGLREAEVVLTDAANVTLDSTLGNTFKLTAAGNRQIDAPTNKPASGFVQKIVIAHEASGADRTLTLQTGVAGGFRFGTSITALSATTNGLVDYIGCIYNDADDRWDVVSYVKGF